jgi:hypothetical protein
MAEKEWTSLQQRATGFFSGCKSLANKQSLSGNETPTPHGKHSTDNFTAWRNGTSFVK